MNDFRLFVGRDIELRKLEGVIHPPHNCAWLFGAPRNGKSSIARFVAHKAREAGKNVVYVSAEDLEPGDFNGLLRKIVLGDKGSTSGRNPEIIEKAFLEMAAKSEAQPLLIIIDHFDRQAVNLDMQQQRLLRSTKETYGKLNYLFVTRRDPNRIIEDVVDEGSRLMGICRPIPVPTLSPGHVRDFCRKVAEPLGLVDSYREWSTEIVRAIGGNPEAVADALLSTVASVEDDTTSAGVVLEDASLRETLTSHWRGLPAACRTFLLGAGDADEELSAAKTEGYWNSNRNEAIRPTMLVAVGKSVGLQARDNVELGVLGLVFDLHELINLVNLIAKRSGSKKNIFSTGDELYRYHPLARRITSADELQPAVNHLTKLLYEGSRERVPGEKATENEWRIPAGLARDDFKRADGMKMLIALRLYFDHSAYKESEEARREKEVGEWFLRACGTAVPQQPSQFERIVPFLLGLLCDALQKLVDNLTNLNATDAAASSS
jgi:hypothetical protein